ncbi:hypothetical protein BDA99DRAFT_103289 [Phascolomyces articulosus]|uniref:F-box domain-containing protein n=1 Tax=Phascolomyces articulosus TaxID=60185 RepID=A0AAD5JXH5_9FUNG|nr:hypothetical protein BDA99DRAFT_103289 [Phascolomyces articulosus]
MTTIRFSTSSSPIPPMDSHSYLTLNHLDLTATRNAFDQGKRAFASEDYSQAIRSYTDALNHLYADLESTILLHRAVANEKLRNYDQALEDCAKTNPKNDKAGVYWITSNILLKQGKLEQAGLVYKEALNNIPKDAFPEHKKQFDRMYHAVVAEQVHHNQWLTRTVPYEVLSAILTLLPWSARGQLAFTCRFWYNFVLKEWPEMWSCIDTVYMMPRHPRAIHQLLGKVQPEQVRKVKINLCGLYWCSNDDAYELSNDTTANVQLYGMGDLSRYVSIE